MTSQAGRFIAAGLTGLFAVSIAGCSEPNGPTSTPSQQISASQPPAPPPVPPELTVDDFPPPKARLVITIDSLNSSIAIEGLSQILFDASESTGEGLSYHIDFGDGGRTTEARAHHVVDLGPCCASGGHRNQLGATLIVTDRFGRTDSVRPAYKIQSLGNEHGNPYPYTFWRNLPASCITTAILDVQQNGRDVSGSGRVSSRTYPGCPPAVTHSAPLLAGVLSGERDIRFVMSDGVELWGVVGPSDYRLHFEVRGGPLNGQRFGMYQHQSP